MVRRTRLTRRRRTRRRGGVDKGEIVDAILVAIANAPEKQQLMTNAVASVEPPALKVKVADVGKRVEEAAETPEDGVAKIKALLTELDEDTLKALKTKLESVSMKGGELTPEEKAAVLKQREARIAASKARIAAANLPLSTKLRATGRSLRELLLGIALVLGSAVSSIGGRTRRRRRA